MSKPRFPSHPMLLGFERLERFVEQSARTGTDGYPPFNIEVTGPSSFRITLAVAGFREDELQITVEKRQLLLRGQQHERDAEDRVFLHRGIAARQFQRVFALAEGVDVAGAVLTNGLLHVDLIRNDPEEAVQTIPITKG